VAQLTAAGYGEGKPGALKSVSAALDIPTNTLRRWYKGRSNPPPTKIVRQKELDLRQAIQNELKAIIPQMSATRKQAEYKDLVRAFGIMFDKLQLLEGKPTTRADVNVNDARERLARLIASRADSDGTGSDT
jgi:hypothetical protein